MDMIFYGAGDWGKAALNDFFTKKNKKERFVGFADSHKDGNYMGYPILTIQTLNTRDTIVVITVNNSLIVTEIYKYLKEYGIEHVYWFINKSIGGEEGDFLKDECINCSNWGTEVLPKVEMHIADYCNLNCRGCTHFSPIFNKEFPDLNDRISDVKILKKKVSHIVLFSILGGEPFLNPDIDKYIEEIRKILPDTYIDIVTNGLLIPKLSAEIFECIKRNRIVVSISEYEPTHRIITLIEEILNKHGVLYEIRKYEEKRKFIKPLSLSGDGKYSNKCISNGCVNIWNGKIARCPTLMYIDRFNEVFCQKLPNEGIMPLRDCPDGDELLNVLQKKVPLCRHCVCCEIEWGCCSRSIGLEDFASM